MDISHEKTIPNPKSWNLVCSSHFKDEDFDPTGQTVRLRDVEPSVFTIPEHLRKVRIAFNINLKQTVQYTKYHFQK